MANSGYVAAESVAGDRRAFVGTLLVLVIELMTLDPTRNVWKAPAGPSDNDYNAALGVAAICPIVEVRSGRHLYSSH